MARALVANGTLRGNRNSPFLLPIREHLDFPSLEELLVGRNESQIVDFGCGDEEAVGGIFLPELDQSALHGNELMLELLPHSTS